MRAILEASFAKHPASNECLRSRLALDSTDLKWRILTIPGGAVIVVLSEPENNKPNCQVKIRWQEKTVNMFAVDIQLRGEMVPR